jgi:solute carrier organic anion transporter family, member 3A
MTGLYSEAQDDSSADLPQDGESISRPATVIQPQSVTVSTTLTNPSATTTCITSTPDTVIKCHSRQPSSGLVDREKTFDNDNEELSKDCGILSCRPAKIQKLARIRVKKS